MNLTIRRLTEADANDAHAFLDKLFRDDPDTGGVHAPSRDLLAAQVADGIESWVAHDGDQLVGILGPAMSGVRRMKDGSERTFHLFNRLAVDHALYTASRSDAIRIARELTLTAADDIRAAGHLLDDICIQGPTNSRGASWARLLGFDETTRHTDSIFWLPTHLIWQRCHDTEAL